MANAYDMVFPVLAGHTKGGKFFIQNVIGSSFPVGDDFFLTAGHVLHKLEEFETAALGQSNQKTWSLIEVLETEIFDSHDLGIIRTSPTSAKPTKWHMDEILMLEDVYSLGYPYALKEDLGLLDARGFKGHVVAAERTTNVQSHPRSYKLSFQCPRGLSGGPLFHGSNNNLVGIMVGNEDVEMIVFQQTEKEDDGKQKTVHEKVEAMRLGLAIQTNSLKDLNSKILGKTIGEFLKENSLI